MGQKPAKTAYRAADYTIRIMLRTLRQCDAEVVPSNSRVRRRQERAWRQWPGPSRPFASPAPGRGIGAPISPIPLPRCRSASTASIFKRYLPHQPQSSASILPPYALRAGRHVCDSLLLNLLPFLRDNRRSSTTFWLMLSKNSCIACY